MDIEKLKFPIGPFKKPTFVSKESIDTWISVIETFHFKLSQEVLHLTDDQLNTPYRLNGWTIRQVVHHCADSHMNSLTRFKLALTEECPTIKPYKEEYWAELVDSQNYPIISSLKILDGIHERWVAILKNMREEDFQREFIHPQYLDKYRLDQSLALYAWHCMHHLAHITELKKRTNWA